MHDVTIAIEAIMANKIKSILTALGIIFGVAAVISMLAIGTGAKQEILNQMKLVGVNNIVVSSLAPDNSTSNNSENASKSNDKKFSKGLTIEDAFAIQEVVPTVINSVSEITLKTNLVKDGKIKESKVVGVTNNFFDLFHLTIKDGHFFNAEQEKYGFSVCVIGTEIKAKLFRNSNPVNQYVKCGTVWLKVVGVIEKRNLASTNIEKLHISNTNENVYIPLKTMLLRFTNRSLITEKRFETESDDDDNEKKVVQTPNYNQLDRIIVQVSETEKLTETATIIKRILLRRHSNVEDFDVIVPELLLKQQQKAKDIFNIVLGAIASISLIVGGIGIMNIMLASVLERIKEIGTRMAIGATRRDIVIQFLAEAILICLSGGFIGIILGIVLSKLVTQFAGILTIVSLWSVFIAFIVSVSVGIIFGYLPAKRASMQDPVVSLRYE